MRENSDGITRLPTIGITGAGGFVGRHLLDGFARRGHRVVAFTRDERHVPPGFETRRYDLDAGLLVGALADIDVLIHAAFIQANASNEDASARNIRGTLALYESTVAAGSRFIFISTLSAGPAASSAYGQHKYVIENALVAKDALVIRPGLVVGDGGLIRSLYSTIRRGVVPLIDGGLQAVQVVGTDDLAAAIECAVQGELRGCHNVCAAEPVTTSHVARTLAKHFGIKPLYVYVPWPFAYLLATIAERLRIALPLTTENLLGMRSVEYAAPSPALAQLGWKARTWSELLPQLAFR